MKEFLDVVTFYKVLRVCEVKRHPANRLPHMWAMHDAKSQEYKQHNRR